MRKILIDCLSDFIRTAVVENGELVELIIEEKEKKISVGSIYTGIVKKILPSQFAFIDLGDEKNTFLHLSDKKEESLYRYNEFKNQNELIIKNGQDIVVQVVKEPTELKGAVVTTQLSFAGKYVVLLCGEAGINISKKITEEKERQRLYNLGNDIVSKMDGMLGLIMRTNCLGQNSEVISEEIEKLVKVYVSVSEKGKYSKAPYEIYSAENETQKVIRDLINNDGDEVIVNDEEEYRRLLDFDGGNGRVSFYDGVVPMFDNFFVEKQIEKALHSKIWLKCGGFIIIDSTEACTVIDVNTGKYSGKNHRETVLKTNIEAASEIAKQLRLRNLSGMIIIDFIDMRFEEDREKVREALVEYSKRDRVGVVVVGMTELGLMQLTRKKVRRSLQSILTCKCPFCGGSGIVLNERYISDKIRNEICSIFSSTIYNEVVLSSNLRVINAFKGKNDDYRIIEKKFGGKISFNIIETQKLDYYKLDKIKNN